MARLARIARLLFTSYVVTLVASGCDGSTDQPTINKKTFAYTPLTCSDTLDRDVEISTWEWQALDKNTCEQGTYGFWINCNKYAPYTYRPWRMLFSQNVKSIKFYFDIFYTEEDFDRLILDGLTTWHGRAYESTTAPTLNQYTESFNVSGGGVRTAYLDFIWMSDYSYIDTGYRISKIRTTCNPANPNQVNDVWVQRNYPHDGYLLGTGDVIYVWTAQPPGYDMGILVWPRDPTHNIDLHVSGSVTKPGWGSTWNSTYGTGYPDMVRIPGSSCTGPSECNRYIAIASKSGKGQFRFYANIHTNHSFYGGKTLVARTDFTPIDETTKNVIRTQMRKISQAMYFATDGRHLFDNWKMHWNPPTQFPPGYYGPHPPVWWKFNTDDGPYCIGNFGRPCGLGGFLDYVEHVSWGRGFWGGVGHDIQWPPSSAYNDFVAATAVHEFGHCMYGFDHATQEPPSHDCGYSRMGLSTSHEANLVDFCTFYNGGKNPVPGKSGHPTSENEWDCLKSRLTNWISYPAIETPDPFFKTSGLTNETPFNNNMIRIDEYSY